MKKTLLFTFLMFCAFIPITFAQVEATADFRSRASGNFNDLNTWEFDNGGGNFVNATQVPTTLNNIIIATGTTVTQNVNFTIQNGKSFTMQSSSAYIINPEMILAISGSADFNAQPVLFKSAAAIIPKSAMLGIVTGTLAGASNVTVERFIAAGKRAYRHLATGVIPSTNIWNSWQNAGVATPGLGLHITGNGTNGLDLTQTSNANLYSYTPDAVSFSSVLSTNGVNDKLNPLTGYRLFVYGDRNADLTLSNNNGSSANNNIALNSDVTLRSIGTPITGDVFYNSTGGQINAGAIDASARLSATAGNYSFIANPYWSPVDFDVLSKSDIDPTYYIWDPTLGKRGQYVSWTTGTGSSNGISQITKDIQPGQAMFIRTNGANPFITFSEINKTVTQTATFRSPGQSPSKLRLYLMDITNGNMVVDGSTAVYRDDFYTAVGAEDASKLSNPDENLAIRRGTHKLAIEGRPTVSTNDTSTLLLWNLYHQNQYAVRFDGQDFDPFVTGTLRDKLTGQIYQLDLGGSFTLPFTFNLSDSATFYNRFEIVLKPVAVLPISFSSVKAFPKGAAVQVEWTNATEGNIAHYEIERAADATNFVKIGSLAAIENNNSAVSYSFLDRSPLSGDNYYRIKAIEKTGVNKNSIIVKIATGRQSSFVAIYPNPVTDNRFTVQLNNLPKGEYRISLSNMNGQQVFTQSIYNQANTITETVELQKYLLKGGMYTATIVSVSGVLVSTEKLIIKHK